MKWSDGIDGGNSSDRSLEFYRTLPESERTTGVFSKKSISDYRKIVLTSHMSEGWRQSLRRLLICSIVYVVFNAAIDSTFSVEWVESASAFVMIFLLFSFLIASAGQLLQYPTDYKAQRELEMIHYIYKECGQSLKA